MTHVDTNVRSKLGRDKKQLLIVGAASGMGRLIAQSFAREDPPAFEIFGIDSRPLPRGDHFGGEFPGEFLQVGYTKRRLAEVFRQGNFAAMIHVGRISSISPESRRYRLQQNVYGTANLLRLGLAHGIAKFVILGTHLTYGAVKDSPLYLREDEPLRASEGYPALFDAIELDLETRAFIWKNRQAKTVLLRPVHIIGPETRHALASLLLGRYCPKLLGFDPLMQLLDERDAVRAVKLAVEKDIFGIFNVAGEGVLTYSKAIELSKSRPLTFPQWLAPATSQFKSLFGSPVPYHFVNYIKYPTIISDRAFREAVGWKPEFTILESLRNLIE